MVTPSGSFVVYGSAYRRKALAESAAPELMNLASATVQVQSLYCFGEEAVLPAQCPALFNFNALEVAQETTAKLFNSSHVLGWRLAIP